MTELKKIKANKKNVAPLCVHTCIQAEVFVRQLYRSISLDLLDIVSFFFCCLQIYFRFFSSLQQLQLNYSLPRGSHTQKQTAAMRTRNQFSSLRCQKSHLNTLMSVEEKERQFDH